MDGKDIQPSPKVKHFDRLFLYVAGADVETLKLCPQSDWECVRAVAVIMIFVWIYQTALFSVIAHRLFSVGGYIRPDLILVSTFLSTFILQIDCFAIMRSGWHTSGISELLRGGMNIAGGLAARIKAAVFLGVRIFLSICLAQLSAIFLGLLIFSSDITQRISSAFVQQNASIIASATKLKDENIKQDTDALNAESAREAILASQVSSLRQDQVDPYSSRPEIQQGNQEVAQLLAEKTKADEALQSAETFASDELGGIKGSRNNSGIAGDGPKRRAAVEALENARNTAKRISDALERARARLDAARGQVASLSSATQQQSQTELPGFERELAAEEDKVKAMRETLSRDTDGRDGAVRTSVTRALSYLPPENGLLSQIEALEHVAQGDPKIAGTIILIDLISFGFELAAVLAKVTSFVPTVYAALTARNSYMRVVRIVDEMADELNHGAGDKAPDIEVITPAARRDRTAPGTGTTPGSDPFHNAADPFAPAARRPRGRPPKASYDTKPDGPLPFDDFAAQDR